MHNVREAVELLNAEHGKGVIPWDILRFQKYAKEYCSILHKSDKLEPVIALLCGLNGIESIPVEVFPAVVLLGSEQLTAEEAHSLIHRIGLLFKLLDKHSDDRILFGESQDGEGYEPSLSLVSCLAKVPLTCEGEINIEDVVEAVHEVEGMFEEIPPSE